MNRLVYVPELSDIVKMVLEEFHSDRLVADELDFIGYFVFAKKLNYSAKISRSGKRELALYRKYVGPTSYHVFSIFINVGEILREKDNKITIAAGRLTFLVDHELMHLERIENNGKVGYKIVSHDIEDFIDIIRRWNSYNINLSGRAHISLADFSNMIKPSKVEQGRLKSFIKELKKSDEFKKLVESLN